MAAFGAPVIAVALLYLLGVPLGSPDFYLHRYSHLVSARLLASAVPLLLVLLVIVVAPAERIFRLGHAAMLVLTMLITMLLALWAVWAGPKALQQNVFNLLSPSHDGAFVIESWKIESASNYLAHFPERLEASPKEELGTRVLSNPPGITLLTYGVRSFLQHRWGFAHWLLEAQGADLRDGREAETVSQTLLTGWVLLFAWVAATVFVYALAAIWLEPLPAAIVTLICVFNPATACFSPGKDPVQLLTISAFLWGWLSSRQRRRWLPAIVSGFALAVGLCVGLVHAWIAIIVAVASGWLARGDRRAWKDLVLFTALPASGALVAACLAAWLVWGWNVPATLLATLASYERVTDVIGRPPWYWLGGQWLIFALFAGGGVWYLSIRRVRVPLIDADARPGRALLAATVVVMIYSSFYTALETPRLWIAFLPLVVVGLALGLPEFRRPEPRQARMLLVIGAMQIATTCLIWAFFDVRESEMRLITGRLFS